MRREMIREGRKGAVFLLAFLGLRIGVWGLCQQTLEEEPNAVIGTEIEENRLTWEEAVKKRQEGLRVGVSGQFSYEQNRIQVINEEYSRFFIQTLKAGESMDFQKDTPQMLLSEEKAKEQKAGPGSKILLGQTEYIVAGILKDPEERDFFAAVNMSPKGQEVLADTLVFWNESNQPILVRDKAFSLNELYGREIKGKFQNISLMKEAIWGINRLVLVLGLLPVLLFLEAQAYRRLVLAYKKEGRRWGDCFASFLSGMAFFAAGLAFWYFMIGRVQLPQQYLPEDQIFSLTYYLQELGDFFQSLKGGPGQISSLRAIAKTGMLSAALSLLSAVFFWLFWFSAKKSGSILRKDREKGK